MIAGKLKVGPATLTTHNDSYALAGIRAVSTRRPFLSAGLSMSVLLLLFMLGFIDLMYPGEVFTVLIIATLCAGLGLKIGRLTLVSRDLTGSQVADAVYGTYGHLTRERLKIAAAIETATHRDPQ